MQQILFTFGPITIYSYGMALFIAISIALYLLIREADRQGFNKDIIFDLAITILFFGIVGARISYILLNLKFYLENPLEIIMLHHGGLAILGGIAFGLISAFQFIRLKKLSFFRTMDLIVPYVALAHSIGRIGCFFNGCCYGIPSKFGIYFPVHDATLLPTQLISSFLLLMLFVTLRIRQVRPHLDGVIFISYLIYYSIIRFLLEFLRADSQKLFLDLTIFQYFCIALFIFGIFLSAFAKKPRA